MRKWTTALFLNWLCSGNACQLALKNGPIAGFGCSKSWWTPGRACFQLADGCRAFCRQNSQAPENIGATLIGRLMGGAVGLTLLESTTRSEAGQLEMLEASSSQFAHHETFQFVQRESWLPSLYHPSFPHLPKLLEHCSLEAEGRSCELFSVQHCSSIMDSWSAYIVHVKLGNNLHACWKLGFIKYT